MSVAEAGPAPTVAELGRIVRGVDPSAFVVPARIVRRAIKHVRGLPAVVFRVPHRRSFVIGGRAAAEGGLLAPEELGLEPGAPLPATVLLLAEPEDDELGDRPRAEVIREYWRRLYHARIHVELERRVASGEIGPLGLRDRIRRIDPTAFEEARSVLDGEDSLLPPRDDSGVYVEFAATYLELRAFADHLIPAYFPAIRDHEAVEAALSEDVDPGALLEATRLPGAARPSESFRPADEQGPLAADDPEHEAPSGERYRQLLGLADRAAAKGNLVRAAILRTQAARLAGPSLAGQARSAARKAIEGLAARLGSALGLESGELAEWRKALLAPLERSSRGSWTPEARLLYDVQKVCVDHERPFYTVDLVEWALSLGRRPIRRLLPSHQDVLIMQHLRGAARHLAAARLPEGERGRASRLLAEAVDRAEGRLRDRFRPAIGRALEETGFAARDLPERVAVQKLVEELLDRVVERGFLAMGDLRDALSRNGRKLPDLAGPAEFFRGDRLLRADRKLGVALDGVYRRGEAYLRALQRLSALAFGTKLGRLLTRYLALPYGGAFVILKGLQEVGGPLSESLLGQEVHLFNPASLAIGGTLAIGLLYSREFRVDFGRYLRRGFDAVHGVVVGVPSWLIRRDWVRRIFESPAFSFAWRAVLLPLAPAAGLWLLRPRSEDPALAVIAPALTFLATSALLTTRAGRDLEELAVDSFGRAWGWFLGNLVPGLFRLVMETFDGVLEAVERVLYTVDEWLRFRGGQGRAALVAKAILGVAWFFVTYVVRFCVTLLIEPQVNPIKHFPVVTVSHKIMLTQALTLKSIMTSLFGLDEGLAIAGAILLLMPGVFGFLVWELKENWRLYEANRPADLRPATIGHHGETMSRLLKPGFHSGTLPKLFARLRRAEVKADRTGQGKGARRQLAGLHGVEESVRHFVDREFLTLLLQSRSMAAVPLALGEVVPSAKRFLVEILRPGRPGPGLWLSFEEHAGWLVAGVAEAGWLAELDPPGRQALGTALAGLYKLAGVQLVRESILEALGPDGGDFDLRPEGVVVRPDPASEAEIVYLLKPEAGVPALMPVGRSGLEAPPLDPARLLFADLAIPWRRWVEVWERDRGGEDHPADLIEGVALLPRVPERTAT